MLVPSWAAWAPLTQRSASASTAGLLSSLNLLPVFGLQSQFSLTERFHFLCGS